MGGNISNRGGDLWQLRIWHRGRSYYRHVHGSEQQARAALEAFLDEFGKAGVPAVNPSTRFEAWANIYLAHQTHLAPLTLDAYNRRLALYLLPAFGRRRLCDLVADDGLELQTRMLRIAKAGGMGLSASTVREAMRLATDIIDLAVRMHTLRVNPFRMLPPIRVPRLDRQVIAPPDFRKLAAIPPGPIADILAFALETGARRGEILALTWADVRHDNLELAIGASLEQLDGVIRSKSPKSNAGRRTVGLSAAGAEQLRRKRLAAAEAALGAGRDIRTLPVFAAADGLSWANPDTVSQQCRRALQKAGLPDSLHGMRHANATALLSSGVNPEAVRKRLGHSNISTTLGTYAHALPQDDRHAVAVMAELTARPA